MNQRLLFLQLVLAEDGGRISFSELAERMYGEVTQVTLNRVTSIKYLASKSHPHIAIESTPPNSRGGMGFYWWAGGSHAGQSRKSSGVGDSEGVVDRRSKNRKQISKRRRIGPNKQQDDSRTVEPSKRRRKRSRVSKSGIYSDV